jgi:O-antigen/teichoic acid export membrane protein
MSDDSRTLGAQPREAGPRRLIARNFLSLSVASLAGRFVSLFSGIYIRRVLEVVAIGQISWCSAVMSYFSLIINPGLETIAKRDVAREPDKAGHYVSILLMVQFILAVVGFAFVASFAALGLRGPQVSMILSLQAFALLLAPLNLTWLLQANERMGPAAFAEVVSQVLMLPALFLFIHNPTHVVRYVLLVYPFRIGVIVYLAWYAGRRHLLEWKEVRPTLQGSGALLKQALPLGLSQGAILLFYNFDAIFLGFARGDATVGLYSTAYNLMLMPLMFSGSLTSAYFPSLARAQGETQQMQRVSMEFLRILEWVGFPIAALGWAAGSHVVRLLYGPEFAPSGPLLEWLSLNIALVFFNVGISQPFIAWGRQTELFYITLLAALLNVVLNCALIPRYGVWAAVATTILSEVAVLICGLIYRRKICPISWLRVTLKPLGFSVLTAAVVRMLSWLFPGFWWAAVATGVILFAAVFWFTEGRTFMKLLNELGVRHVPQGGN